MRWALLILCLLATPLAAVQPDEMLSDPALESRARALSEGLRCPVCRNESIDESDAEIAGDLRVLLRERLVAGDSDADAVQFLVDRYGEYILLNPRVSGANWLLWLAAPFMLILAGGIALATIRARSGGAAPDGLSDDEQAQLSKILNKD